MVVVRGSRGVSRGCARSPESSVIVTVAEGQGTTERACTCIWGRAHTLAQCVMAAGQTCIVMCRCCASKTNRQESRSVKSVLLNTLRLQLRWMKKILVLS